MNKDEAKQEIQKLVEKYQRVLQAGKIKSYNEAQTRNEFIEPLFGFLGWDMRNLNTDGEVTTEENVSGGRVDLAFRLGNVPAFFLEAKAMKIDLDEWKWAEQAINYSWNKSATWAVLTDFESIKIFNAEIPPKDVSRNLFIELGVREYIDRFDQLWLLSKESFETRLLDKEAEKWGKLTKRKQVGEKLFEDLMNWRIALSVEFKKHNNLTNNEIDEGVQRILDRLIFIRTAEDRKTEQVFLQALLREWETKGKKHNIYKKLIDGFRWFDENYNSKLFTVHYCEKWQADNEVFTEILIGLYETKDGYRYDFSAISADVLGGIYEQYLSFVQVRKGEDKSKSKRKSQGIYYTPRYIVEFIVKETLGEVLKRTKPRDIPKIKVLDPACGSGSFLTAAYDKILEYVPTPNLFTKFDILKDNIYGTDLDAQAVEIAQLNLLLKVLFQRTKLPTLQHNLRVGNSLISEGELDQKPFNFETEFREVSEQGGFDVIIGNPPYIKEDTNRAAFDGLHNSPYYQGKMDIWTLFACQAIDLLKNDGYFSFIAPSSWLGSAGASIFRKKILNSGEIVKFVDFNDFQVFKDASIQTMIFIFQKKKPRNSYKVQYAKITGKNAASEEVSRLLAAGLNKQVINSIIYEAKIKSTNADGKSINFSIDAISEVLNKIEKVSNFKLSKGDIGNGIDVLQDFVSEKHLPKLKDKTIKKGDGVLVLENPVAARMNLNEKELEYLKPYYGTSQINRYLSDNESRYKIIYADKYFREHIDEFPNLKNYLDLYKEILTSVFAPYGLHRPREEKFFNGPAVFLLRKTMRPAFTYVDFPCYVTRAFLILKPEKIDLKYLTALLNSKLVYFWLKNKGKKQGEQLQVDKEPLMDIPLLKVDTSEQNKFAALVDTAMARNAELNITSANTDKWHALKAEVEKSENEIDQLVYKLYGLTNEEIETIEG